MLRHFSIFCLSTIAFAGLSHAQTTHDLLEEQVKPSPSLESLKVADTATIQTVTSESDLISTNSTAAENIEPSPFLDAYELGFIESGASAQKQELTQDELAKIKKSFDVPKSKEDPRYKPVFNIRAGEEKPEWKSGDVYPAGR